jgi:tartrate dehydratase beta subunit/fumarate hydratase class I family protein
MHVKPTVVLLRIYWWSCCDFSARYLEGRDRGFRGIRMEEAVRKITIKDFPAFIITDDKGNDFFENL